MPAFGNDRDLARKLEELESMLKSRLDVHEAAIVDVLQQMMRLLNPPPYQPDPSRGKSDSPRARAGSKRLKERRYLEERHENYC